MAIRPVRIHICSKQLFEGVEEETVEQYLQGKLLFRDGHYLLTYDEGEPGRPVAQSTTMWIEPELVRLQRKGTVYTDMTFQKGQRHESRYETPYGALPLFVQTRRIRSRWTGMAGEVELEYELELGGQLAGVNRLHMKVEPL